MKKYNFSAGPAVLPESVLLEARDEFLNYKNTGSSVMELSHRSKEFMEIMEMAKQDLRKIANIPDTYDILFLQGGASTQFSMIPMNLMRNRKADYIVTGEWSKKAYKEAKLFGDINVLGSSEDDGFSYIPDVSDLDVREDADYVYITENNTIYGTQYKELPNTKGKILVNDASSCILSKPFDVNRFGLIYAGAQKNLGPAGVTLVVIRKDLISDEVLDGTPTMMKYKTHSDKKSSFNTPPTFSIYIMSKVLKWIDSIGGLEVVEKMNQEKAKILYEFIDQSKIFTGIAHKDYRSLMNVSFRSKSKEMDEIFVAEAEKEGFISIAGHRNIGGMRASIYNAMPIEAVKSLVEFMDEFERKQK